MSESVDFHEQFRAEAPVKTSSNRTFGYVFTALFAIIGCWPWWKTGGFHEWALVVAAAFLVVTLLIPRALAPLQWLWMRFGAALHKVMNPVLLGLMFFVTVAPTGLIMRALGKRPLGLAFDKDAKSYWITREPPGPAPETMTNQF
jgi:hypothetical protein